GKTVIDESRRYSWYAALIATLDAAPTAGHWFKFDGPTGQTLETDEPPASESSLLGPVPGDYPGRRRHHFPSAANPRIVHPEPQERCWGIKSEIANTTRVLAARPLVLTGDGTYRVSPNAVHQQASAHRRGIALFLTQWDQADIVRSKLGTLYPTSKESLH